MREQGNQADARLRAIDEFLYWYGKVNRQDLIDLFEISKPQASLDIRKYVKIYGNNIEYNPSSRSYVRSQTYKPVLFEPDVYQFLGKSSPSGNLHILDTTIEMPKPLLRNASPDTLSRFTECLSQGKRLHAHYQSIHSGEKAWRWLYPARLIFDGHRLHARSFCYQREEWRDFCIGRVLEVQNIESCPAPDLPDTEWEEEIEILYETSPSLNPESAGIVAMEYGMNGGKGSLVTKKALLLYALKALGVDERAPDNTLIKYTGTIARKRRD